MNTRPIDKSSDPFLDELSYLKGPICGIYKTCKNARKYIISGLNSIDSQLKGITYLAFNGKLSEENGIKYIDHWMSYLQSMKTEIERFQSLVDFEQNALKKRVDFINVKYEQMTADDTEFSDYHHFAYSVDDKQIISENASVDEPQPVQPSKYSDRHFLSIWSDRLLIDYFHRNSYFLTANALIADNEELTELSNVRLWHKLKGPMDAIKQRNAALLIKWCKSNKTLLKREQNDLEFLCRERFVVGLLRNGQIEQATEYLTNEIAPICKSEQQWKRISKLFICAMFVPIIFSSQNAKYDKLLKNPKDKRLKKEFRDDCKRKLPKFVYVIFFKAAHFWKAIECEFLRVFKAIYGLNEHSMLEYVLSSSLQTLLTPYCYHREWTHPNCITCKYGKNKMAQLAHKSHLRGIELPNSQIVCDKETDFRHKQVENGCNEYEIIKDCMVTNEHSMAIKSNPDAILTPNGCVIHKDAAKGLSAKNNWIENDFKKIYLCYDLF